MSDRGPAPRRVLPLPSTDWVTPEIDFDLWEKAFKKKFTKALRRKIATCAENAKCSVRYISEREFDNLMNQLAKDGEGWEGKDEDDKIGRALRRDLEWHVRYHSDRTGDWKADVRKAKKVAEFHAIEERDTQRAERCAREAYAILEKAGFKLTLSGGGYDHLPPNHVEQFFIDLFFPQKRSNSGYRQKIRSTLKNM